MDMAQLTSHGLIEIAQWGRDHWVAVSVERHAQISKEQLKIAWSDEADEAGVVLLQLK